MVWGFPSLKVLRIHVNITKITPSLFHHPFSLGGTHDHPFHVPRSDQRRSALGSPLASYRPGPIILMLWEDKKSRPFIRAHNVQALILGIISVLTSTICIGLLVWFYQLYCAYKAYQGEMVEVPVISNLVKNQGWA
jgi:uncharacterized membrane protein